MIWPASIGKVLMTISANYGMQNIKPNVRDSLLVATSIIAGYALAHPAFDPIQLSTLIIAMSLILFIGLSVFDFFSSTA